MSTLNDEALPQAGLANEPNLHAFLCGPKTDTSLFEPERLRERLIALDRLDARFGGFDSEGLRMCADSRIHKNAKSLQARLEAANEELYRSVRFDIVRGLPPFALLPWFQDSARRIESKLPVPGLGFDCRDEMLSGILQLREPSEPNLLVPEMVPYQPTPLRHILYLAEVTTLAENDVFVDLGSGLGHVPLLVSMITGAQSLGIEVQAAYVACAQECARSLHLSRVRFLAQDARNADLSSGTVFYLYSPFKGSILTDILSSLRMESARRSITICSLGPCTRTLAKLTWLQATTLPETGRITVFESQGAHRPSHSPRVGMEPSDCKVDKLNI